MRLPRGFPYPQRLFQPIRIDQGTNKQPAQVLARLPTPLLSMKGFPKLALFFNIPNPASGFSDRKPFSFLTPSGLSGKRKGITPECRGIRGGKGRDRRTRGQKGAWITWRRIGLFLSHIYGKFFLKTIVRWQEVFLPPTFGAIHDRPPPRDKNKKAVPPDGRTTFSYDH